MRKTRKVAAVLWCVQVDAAAKVGAEVDGGGGAPRLATRGRQRRKARRGEKKRPFGPIYKAKGHVSGATIKGPRNGAVASISADILIKEA